MEFNPTDQTNQTNRPAQTTLPGSSETKDITESEFIKVDGPFVSIKGFAFFGGAKGNFSVDEWKVESMAQLMEKSASALSTPYNEDMRLIFQGKQVSDLATFCDIVTGSGGKGNATFLIAYKKRS